MADYTPISDTTPYSSTREQVNKTGIFTQGRYSAVRRSKLLIHTTT